MLTWTTDIYEVTNYNTVPIGASLQITFNFLATVMDDVSLIALNHSIAHDPLIMTDYLGIVNVTFGQVGFSINGSYILCSGDNCGSKIIINVTG